MISIAKALLVIPVGCIAAILEINDKGIDWLWFLYVVLVLFIDLTDGSKSNGR